MPRTKNRHGEHQEVHIGEFSVNEVGLILGSVQRQVPEDFDNPNWTLLSKGAAPPMGTVPCVGVKRGYDEPNSLAIYTYSYQGQQSEYGFADSEIVFELDGTMTEDRIETNPNFGVIKTKYGWLTSKRQFPEFMPGGGTGGQGLPGAGSAGTPEISKRNDLYGSDSYLAFGAIFSKTYVRGAIPSAVLRGLGAISTPPGIGAFQLPPASAARNWLKIAPLIRKRGNMVQITERWMLSGPRGWNKDVYGAPQLEKDYEDASQEGF